MAVNQRDFRNINSGAVNQTVDVLVIILAALSV